MHFRYRGSLRQSSARQPSVRGPLKIHLQDGSIQAKHSYRQMGLRPFALQPAPGIPRVHHFPKDFANVSEMMEWHLFAGVLYKSSPT